MTDESVQMPYHLTLEDLIAKLQSVDPKVRIKYGFAEPDSYRGYYNELAFVPASDMLVGEMLRYAKGALNKTYVGYKGGEYKMTHSTRCWLAYWGHEGESLGAVLLDLMLNNLSDKEEYPW